MNVIEVPVLGQPLAGKTTVLLRARDAFGGRLRFLEFKLEVDDAFNGQPCRLAVLDLNTLEASGQLWCLPGGSEPEWLVPLLPRQTAAVFVFDNQESTQDAQRAWFRAQAKFVDLDRSIAIVTRRDLAARVKTVEPEAVIPRELRRRPFAYISAIDPASAPLVERILAENMHNFTCQAGTPPFHQRAASTLAE